MPPDATSVPLGLHGEEIVVCSLHLGCMRGWAFVEINLDSPVLQLNTHGLESSIGQSCNNLALIWCISEIFVEMCLHDLGSVDALCM